MRTSCNGCRVLRKACNETCAIRPCLHWIKNPESQARATLFLAKFYGRAGLLNLLAAAPENMRPGVFRSLLYEACGRVVNPVHGSAGLLTGGSWQLCHEAVEAVLSGAPIKQLGGQLAEAVKIGEELSRVEEDGGSSVASMDSSHLSQTEPVEEDEVGLELSLGLEPPANRSQPDDTCRLGLRL
ncbi:LOB domain-containing protein 41-like [Dioscorea cayenensis subsp. rotundata]|uniref:LOB domain-containing protein 41-like n=1 Tax=Dioscorea cayennensis subsp. rotundata TaxID=55577 RepID=A0AB40CZ34_DIOCR|nr:LOB domain-containing protein 41-like [Dioscorea cayenensis subsp. rotundata]